MPNKNDLSTHKNTNYLIILKIYSISFILLFTFFTYMFAQIIFTWDCDQASVAQV